MSSPIVFCKYDKNSKLGYCVSADGFERWWKYGDNGQKNHYWNSIGYEEWYEYDSNGNCVHYRDSCGNEEWFWEERRTEDPIKILLLQHMIRENNSKANNSHE